MPTPENDGPATDVLRLAAGQYYHKPLAAFFNAFHLRAYQASGVRLESPVLDVGCGDGSFGLVLTDLLGIPPDLTGIEVNASVLRRAAPEARRRYRRMLAASVTELPFAGRTFRTVLFNASLFAVHPGLDRAMREVRRVLAPGGQICATVSTNLYSRHYWLTRVLVRAGLSGWARRYTKAMDRRLLIRHPLSAGQWHALFENHGLAVRKSFGFFTPELTTFWSYLAWTPLRVFGLTQLISGTGGTKLLGRLWAAAFRSRFESTRTAIDLQKATYIWIRAVRPR